MAVGLVAVAAQQLASRGFDWALAAQTLTALRWRWLALALVPMLGTYYGRALRWAVFVRPLKERPSIRNILTATVIGFTAIMLFGRPGEFVRPYLIAVKERVPAPSQFAAWVLERIFDLLMALLVFAFALTRVQASGVHAGERLEWVLAFGGKIVMALCLALLATILSFRHLAKPVQRRLTAALRFLPERHSTKIAGLLHSFVQGVESTKSDGALVAVFLYSVLEWVLIAACYWCLARSFPGLSFSLVDVMIYMGFVSFGSIVQVPGVGGGMQVVAVVVLTELFGVRLELATTFAIVTWLTTFVMIVPVGLLLALKEGLDWHNLRQAGRELST